MYNLHLYNSYLEYCDIYFFFSNINFYSYFLLNIDGLAALRFFYLVIIDKIK